jgi:hypothetical protein
MTVLLPVAAAGCTDQPGRPGPAPLAAATDAPGPGAASREPRAGTPPTSAAGPDSGHRGDGLPPGLLQGNLGVVDQHGDGSQLLVSAEIDGTDGWVVVQADQDGRRGEVLGLAHRRNEAHDDTITVPLRRRVASGPLWVTLCVDAGTPGVFDNADTPVQFSGGDLTRSVLLTVD